jgi:hypothetical protein
LRIPAKFFGRLMSCSHCQGEFRAGNEQMPKAPPNPEAKSGTELGQFIPAFLNDAQLGEVQALQSPGANYAGRYSDPTQRP